MEGVKLLQIYKGLSDETRLRILHLLTHQPLCVCHLQEVLRASQVKISKHLAYLRDQSFVETRREGAWIIYSLPGKPGPELTAQLRCLQECGRDNSVLVADLRRVGQALARCGGPLSNECPAPSLQIASSAKK